MIARHNAVILCLVLTAGGLSGCILGNRPMFVDRGSRDDEKTFYLDGAGNYGFGKESVPLGLADGGYKGHVEHYIWTTYLGPLVDQLSYNHNRREGRGLARKIEAYLDAKPGANVNIIALSAGTGVAVFALEELRPGYTVDHVVLLSSSLSSNYDLTRALRHTRGGIYFFWSPDDPVLQGVVPIVGTVDRADAAPAGTWGATLPYHASAETRQLYYERVHNIRWSPESFLSDPLRLQHAGSISRSVIRDKVAPILMARTIDRTRSTTRPVAGATASPKPPPRPQVKGQPAVVPRPPARGSSSAPGARKLD